MKKLVYALPQKSLKRDSIFNMIGSMANASVSVILQIVVSYLAYKSLGIISLAYPMAQMMYTIGVFEMRNIQVTDAKRTFSFGDVFMFRIISVSAMLAYTFSYILFKYFTNAYTAADGIVVVLLTLYMAILAFSDVFQGVLHLNGYLYLSGISIAAVTFMAVCAFSITLFITKNLIISVIPMILVAGVWVFIYDIPFASNLAKIRPKFDFKIQKAIFLCALPVFLSSFLQQYIFNAQNNAINHYDKGNMGLYGCLVKPIFFINLLSIFVFRPLLVSLSERWANKEYKSFIKTVRLLYLFIVGILACALIGAYFLGIPVLQFIFRNVDFSGTRNSFLILLVAGAFSAGCSLTLTMLTLIRKQGFGLIAYITVGLTAYFLPDILVKTYGFSGACISYCAEMGMLFCILFFILFMFIRKNIKADKR